MFEHLDDPTPFRPTDRLRRAVATRGRRLRLRRRVTAALTSVVLVAGAAGGAAVAYVDRRDAAIDRTRIATRPSLDGAINVLVVGTDVGQDRDVGGIRADTIVVVRIRLDGTIGALSLPRDVIEPGTGGRLGSTRAEGSQALVDAVDRLTGIPVDHYVEMDMDGFADLVDELGGLRLVVDAPLWDESAGLDLQPSACATLDGETALALIRARHVETVRDGRRESDPTGDLGRMARTQAVAAAAVSSLAGMDATPGELDRLTRVLADHAAVDDDLTLGRMVEIARVVAAAGPAGVDAGTVPVVEGGDGATLELAPEAAAVFETYGADRPPAQGDGATTRHANTERGPIGLVPIRPC